MEPASRIWVPFQGTTIFRFPSPCKSIHPWTCAKNSIILSTEFPNLLRFNAELRPTPPHVTLLSNGVAKGNEAGRVRCRNATETGQRFCFPGRARRQNSRLSSFGDLRVRQKLSHLDHLRSNCSRHLRWTAFTTIPIDC